MALLFGLAAIPFALLGVWILWVALIWSVKLFGLFIKLICCLVGATVSVAVDAFHGASTKAKFCMWLWGIMILVCIASSWIK